MRTLNKFKKITSKILIILASMVLSTPSLLADARLIARLHPAPLKAVKLATKDFKKEAKKAAPEVTNTVGGFLTLYGGYYDYSNKDGAINYPLRHEDKKIYVAITPKIEVSKLYKETVSHIKADKTPDTNIPTGEKAKIYLLEKQKGEDAVWFWKVSEQQIPQNRRLSKISLIIISDPNNIFVPIGNFVSQESEHLILPQIHVLGRKNLDKHILENLDATKYFEPIAKTAEKLQKKVQRDLITNF